MKHAKKVPLFFFLPTYREPSLVPFFFFFFFCFGLGLQVVIKFVYNNYTYPVLSAWLYSGLNVVDRGLINSLCKKGASLLRDTSEYEHFVSACSLTTAVY